MTDVEKLVEKMAHVGYIEPSEYRKQDVRAMLRIVLSEIQNGGVVDWAYKYYDDLTAHKAIVLKPDFANFLAERE